MTDCWEINPMVASLFLSFVFVGFGLLGAWLQKKHGLLDNVSQKESTK